MSFQAIGSGSGILGYRPCWCPSPFPIRRPYGPYLDVFQFTLHLPLDFIHVSSLQPIYLQRTHLVNPSVIYSLFISEFPGMGLGSSTLCCGPRDGAEVRILVYSFIALISIKSLGHHWPLDMQCMLECKYEQQRCKIRTGFSSQRLNSFLIMKP